MLDIFPVDFGEWGSVNVKSDSSVNLYLFTSNEWRLVESLQRSEAENSHNFFIGPKKAL